MKTAFEVIKLTIASQVATIREALHDATHEGDIHDPENVKRDILIEGLVNSLEDTIERFATSGLLRSLIDEETGHGGEKFYVGYPSQFEVLPFGMKLELTDANRELPFSFNKVTWFDYFTGNGRIRIVNSGNTAFLCDRDRLHVRLPLSCFSSDA